MPYPPLWLAHFSRRRSMARSGRGAGGVCRGLGSRSVLLPGGGVTGGLQHADQPLTPAAAQRSPKPVARRLVVLGQKPAISILESFGCLRLIMRMSPDLSVANKRVAISPTIGRQIPQKWPRTNSAQLEERQGDGAIVPAACPTSRRCQEIQTASCIHTRRCKQKPHNRRCHASVASPRPGQWD